MPNILSNVMENLLFSTTLVNLSIHIIFYILSIASSSAFKLANWVGKYILSTAAQIQFAANQPK